MIALWSKLKGCAALAGVALFAIGIAFLKGRSEGKAIIAAEQQRQRDALQKHYEEIDAGPADPGAAYERLRNRGRR